MPEKSARKKGSLYSVEALEARMDDQLPHVTVCVGASATSTKVIPHASAIADALEAELTFIHVIEPEKPPHAPSDPVEWDIRRREAKVHVSDLASRVKPRIGNIATKVLEGRSADQICACAPSGILNIIALCSSDDEASGRVGETARRVMESSSGSILLVPITVPAVEKAAYSKLLVPLDGSSRAESAIPFAVKIASAQNAELVLVHAIPQSELMHIGSVTGEDIKLGERLMRRNEGIARGYLDRVRTQLADCGVTVQTLILKNGDAGRLLTGAIADQSADLLVMSALGTSGFSDVPFGHVSSFVISRSRVPILMVRHPQEAGNRHIFSDTTSKGIRYPAGSAK